MRYAIFRTKGGRYGKILDEVGNVLFQTTIYKRADSVRQHLRRWLRQREARGKAEEE